jgi:UDP-N-acetylglucosamine 2-epimerase
MVNYLLTVKGVITDSGGIIKIAPFFGKKCLIPLNTTEWEEVIETGYAKLGMDVNFLESEKIERNKNFYFVKNGCESIINILRQYANKSN